MTARDLNGDKSNYSVPPKTLQVLPSLHCSLHHLRRRPPSSGVHTPQLQHDTGALTLVHTKRANASHYCWADGLSHYFAYGKGKGRSQFIPAHGKKSTYGGGGRAPVILTFVEIWEWSIPRPSRDSGTHFRGKDFLCITHTVEHNYISPSIAVGTQLHVSALYVSHLQVVI